MKLKVQFGEETRFVVPNRKALPTRMLKSSATRFRFRLLGVTGLPKPCKRLFD
jgi:hypothetical protein